MLAIALAVAFSLYGSVLSTRSTLEKSIVIGGAAYGAALAATSIRCVVDPRRGIPYLAWPVLLGLLIMTAAGGEERRKRENRGLLDDDRTRNFGPDGDEMGRGWGMIATLIGLAMSAVAVLLIWNWSKPSAGAAPVRAKPAVTLPAERPAPAPPTPPPAPTVANTIASVLPQMTDDRRAPSEGAMVLARELMAFATWADLVVAKNETSLELVEKDPMAQRGKRLCIAGTLARIEKTAIAGTPLHTARLVTKTGDALEVYAIGSTGALVKRKPARFCGVVTGRLDVETKPATFAVGMFEIK